MAVAFDIAAQTVTFTLLSGNITSTVFDSVPAQPEGDTDDNYPYTAVGDALMIPWDTDSVRGAQVTVAIYSYSRYLGAKEIKELMAEIYSLLHRAAPVLAGYRIIDILFESSAVLTMEDGKTREGVQNFVMTIQEA